MRTYAAEELRRFLRSVDRHLHPEMAVELVLIGGSAAALQYGVRRATADIDVYAFDISPLEPALRSAREETGLRIPVSPAPVAELPLEYESRLARTLTELRRIRAFVPEKHDLVLSKLVRAHEGDLEAVAEIHENHGLDFQLLVARYVNEMRYAIGRPKDRDLGFLAGIERAFGTEMAVEAETQIAIWRKPR